MVCPFLSVSLTAVGHWWCNEATRWSVMPTDGRAGVPKSAMPFVIRGC